LDEGQGHSVSLLLKSTTSQKGASWDKILLLLIMLDDGYVRLSEVIYE